MPDPFPRDRPGHGGVGRGALGPGPRGQRGARHRRHGPAQEEAQEAGVRLLVLRDLDLPRGLRAALRAVAPDRQPQLADPCAGVASTMVNTGATPDQAKLIFVGQATSAQQAQSLIDQGMTVPADVNGCKNPTLDSRVNAYPSATHILGTDSQWPRHLLALIWGARVSLTVGVGAIAVGLLIGGIIGLLAGFYRGKPETLLMTRGRHPARLPGPDAGPRHRGLRRAEPPQRGHRHRHRVDRRRSPGSSARVHPHLRRARVRDGLPRRWAPATRASSCGRSSPT